MNRFSIEPMILNLEHIFSKNSICEKDNTGYIFSVIFFSIVSRDSETPEFSSELGPVQKTVYREIFEVNALRLYSESVRYSNSKTRVKIIKYDFEQSIGSYYIVNHE